MNDAIKNLIIFSYKINITFWYYDISYMDGTFQFFTMFFERMFLCTHGFKNGHYKPLVFILLPRKKYETHVYVFNIIVDKRK